MRIALPAAALLLTACTAMTAANDAADSGWKALPLMENGKLAPGWKRTGFGGFTLVDGALRTDGDPRGLGVFVYEKEKFGDCEIRIVYRSDEPRDNSGIHVRIDDGILKQQEPAPAERGTDGKLTEAGEKAMREASAAQIGAWYAVHRGYEIQICDVPDPYHTTGAVYSLAKAEPYPPKAPDEWKTMVITLDGDLIHVAIDGKRVSTFDPASPAPERKQWYEPEREPKRPTRGYLGLQTHDPGDTVYYKEVAVRPLTK